MKDKEINELQELLHWLAYNFPGIYKQWSDKKNFDDNMDIARLFKNGKD